MEMSKTKATVWESALLKQTKKKKKENNKTLSESQISLLGLQETLENTTSWSPHKDPKFEAYWKKKNEHVPPKQRRAEVSHLMELPDQPPGAQYVEQGTGPMFQPDPLKKKHRA